MTNPFATLKRLLQAPSGPRRTRQAAPARTEKDFMTYDLTADTRF